MVHRVVGATLATGGVALLLFAGGTYARGALARDRARTAWEAIEARRAVADVEAAVVRTPEVAAARPGSPVARLLVPRVGLDEIVVEGVGDEDLNAGPGHLPGSVLPGQRGNAVISAHRDRHFHVLVGVAIGDTVITETVSGRVLWRVVARRIVRRGAPALFSSADPELTLTTCWPIRYIGPAPERLLLTAVPLTRTLRA